MESANRTSIGPQSPFGTIIAINVSSDQAPANPQISNFSAHWLNNSFPVQLSANLKNDGQSNFQQQGTISILNRKNGILNQAKTESLLVYPGASRNFQWQYNSSKKIGFFRAELRIEHGDQVLNKKIWFIVFPWVMLVYSLLAVAITTLLVFVIGKFVRNRISKRQTA
jgi:hypothetical protein